MKRGLTRGGWAVRLVILLGPMVALLVPGLQGFGPPVWLVVVVAAASTAYAAMPDQFTGSVTMLLVLGSWCVEVGSAMPVTVVIAAAALLCSHVAATVASYGPTRLPPDPRIVLRWVRRSVLAWLVAPALWLVVDAYRGRLTPASFWVAGLAVALVLAVAAATIFPTRLDRVGAGG
jgi:hypothetical protein